MSHSPESVVYQLKVVLLSISPMIWRRLLVHSDSTIADLHYILQIVMGWTDSHLHQFTIHGKRYGIAQTGGVWFSDDPRQVKLSDFCFREQEKFLYEYDFGDSWQHQIRVEAIVSSEPNLDYPICIGGKRSAQPRRLWWSMAIHGTAARVFSVLHHRSPLRNFFRRFGARHRGNYGLPRGSAYSPEMADSRPL